MRLNYSKSLSMLALVVLLASSLHMPAPARAAAALNVSDQAAQSGYLAVDSVTADKPGFVVALTTDNKVLGSAPVKAGENGRVRFKIDVNQLSASGITVNLAESDSQTFDLGKAKIVTGKPISVVAIVGTYIQKKSNEVKEVVLPLVVAAKDGFVAIHPRFAQKGFPYSLGEAAVKAGVNKDVKITINKPDLLLTFDVSATLHVDLGEKGKFEFPGPDLPAVLGSTIATEPIGIGEQFVVDASMNVTETKKLFVPAAAATADSWLVLRSAGSKSKILGFVALKPGITKDITLDLTLDPAVPEDAYLQILPKQGDKPEVPTDNGKIIAPDLEPDTIRVIINESILCDGMFVESVKALGGIIVSRVVVSQPTWLRVWDDPNSDKDVAVQLIGAGVHTNVFVPIPASAIPGPKQFVVQLQYDKGKLGVYEWPGGPDDQVKNANKAVIRAALDVTPLK